MLTSAKTIGEEGLKNDRTTAAFLQLLLTVDLVNAFVVYDFTFTGASNEDDTLSTYSAKENQPQSTLRTFEQLLSRNASKMRGSVWI